MKPSKEYMDMISKRLENMNPHLAHTAPGAEAYSSYKIPSLLDQMGQTAIAYMNRKKDEIQSNPDPLFPDRNTY